jgi:hypothetical protein
VPYVSIALDDPQGKAAAENHMLIVLLEEPVGKLFAMAFMEVFDPLNE